MVKGVGVISPCGAIDNDGEDVFGTTEVLDDGDSTPFSPVVNILGGEGSRELGVTVLGVTLPSSLDVRGDEGEVCRSPGVSGRGAKSSPPCG